MFSYPDIIVEFSLASLSVKVAFICFYFRGTEEYLGLQGRVTMINSTLGKALGGAAGGYTTGPQEVITLLRQKSRPYLFSNALPPAVVGSAIKVRIVE